MQFIYKDNNNLIKHIKALMQIEDIEQKDLAEKWNIKPASVSCFFKKKNFCFLDVQKILDVLGYEMEIKFVKKE